MMKTLFLNPPSFDGFDGGAGSRYQAKREIKSFWYPTWLAQPAAATTYNVFPVDAGNTLSSWPTTWQVVPGLQNSATSVVKVTAGLHEH